MEECLPNQRRIRLLIVCITAQNSPAINNLQLFNSAGFMVGRCRPTEWSKCSRYSSLIPKVWNSESRTSSLSNLNIM